MKPRAVGISDEARDDLIRLYEWIAEAASPAVALSYIERLETHIQGFDIASERGHLREDVRPGLRIVGFEHRITIAFTVEDEQVIILRIFYGGLRVGRIEQQHTAVPCAEARGELSDLALDVVDDGRAGPGLERRHHQADALARPRRGEAQHMLGSVVPEIVATELAEYDAVGSDQARRLHFVGPRPAR